jgi:hypothetical protein|nr:MAG TPA: hypothetical protein [Caudoviricetes sp.]
MSCYSCGGNPNTFCRDCTYPKDTWIAPVDKLPDTFMGDFDHLFRTPDGNLYALSPDRTRWIQVNGSGGNAVTYTAGEGIAISNGNVITNTQPNVNQNLSLNGRTISITNGNSITLPEDRDTVYNDTELKKRIQAVESKTDNFVTGVNVSREGNKVKLTYTFVNGAPKEVEFEDKDTITLAYDDSALKARVKALEDRPISNNTTYDDKPLRDRVTALESKPDRDNQTLTLDPNTRSLSLSGGNSVTLPSDKQTLSKDGNKLVLSNGGGEVSIPAPYDDSPLKSRVTALETKPDKDQQTLSLDDTTRVLSISNGNSVTIPSDKQTITRQGNKLVLSNGGGEVDLPQPNSALAYDDTDLRNRVGALEKKPDKDTVYNDTEVKRRLTALEGKTDNDNQALTIDGNKLKLTNGGEVNLDKFSDPVLRISKEDIRETALFEAKTTIPLNSLANKDGVKPGDIVQDIISYRSGGAEFNYWKVTAVEGNNAKLLFMYQDLTNGYNDGELRGKIQALENRPAPTKQKLSLSGNTLSLTDGGSVTLPDNNQPIHRFYDGDIPGRADSNTVKTVPKSGFRNPDGLKVGDTVEDYWSDRNTINRGIWKVTEISGNNVKVQGIGNYDANIRRNLSFNANTRTLSIDEGGSVTLPNDKQTISKNGNKIVLSNGGGEVDIPTATPYNDADIKRRLGVLEAKPDNDKQTLSISGNTLSISNGNSVNIPQPNLSGYVPIAEYNKLKGALEKLLTDLKGSGAWRQTGSTVFEGELYPNRHVATGNINLFGGATDGSSFIRTNNGSTENDLAGGIG